VKRQKPQIPLLQKKQAFSSFFLTPFY